MPSLVAAGATINLIRALACAGLVEYQRESTQESSGARQFHALRNLAFPQGTCFILSDAATDRTVNAKGNQVAFKFFEITPRTAATPPQTPACVHAGIMLRARCFSVTKSSRATASRRLRKSCFSTLSRKNDGRAISTTRYHRTPANAPSVACTIRLRHSIATIACVRFASLETAMAWPWDGRFWNAHPSAFRAADRTPVPPVRFIESATDRSQIDPRSSVDVSHARRNTLQG